LIRKGEHERANSRQSGCAAACCRRGEGLFREGERCQDRPRRTGQGSAPARPWRYADGDAARPAARSTRDLLNILDAIGKARAGFKSLADPWADTTTPHGKLMVTVLAGLAEFERSLILARTGEGRARAKAKGVKFGRPSSLSPHQRKEAMQRLAEGAVQADLARSYGVSQATISRLAAPSPFEVGTVGA